MDKNITVKRSGNSYKVLESFLEEIAHNLANETEKEAKNICPVRTGNLRNSIGQSMLDDETILVGTKDVEYATYVEFGTRFQSPQPFMRNALENSLDYLT